MSKAAELTREELVERLARAQWEARRRWAAKEYPDLLPLEEWGDGSIPKANGIMEEAASIFDELKALGLAIVPVEPTEEMIEKATIFGCDGDQGIGYSDIRYVWAYALSASPFAGN